MDTFYNYKILPTHKVFLQYYRGKVNFDAAVSGMAFLTSDKQYDSSFNSIVDFREAVLQFEEKDAEKFIEFLHNIKAVTHSRRIAFLTDTPNQVVLLSLFTSFAANIASHNIFSTIEASLDWVGIHKDLTSIFQNELDNLKNKPKPIA